LSGFVIDTSALAAVLLDEHDAEQFMEFLDKEMPALVSAATLHEAFCIATRQKIRDGGERLQQMIGLVEPQVVAFDALQLQTAHKAYAIYGRGTSHRANLNMGDCFSYALAKTRNLPLLFKGDDFIHTDVEPALKPA
jgi:ribonuclease VapC